MKKILFILSLSLILASSAQAQKLISFGAKVGLNLTTVSGLQDIINGAKPDFTGGLFFELRPLKFLGLSVEALYSAEGFKTGEVQFNDWTGRIEATMGYISTPILAKFYLTKGFSINAGYQPSFLVSSHIQGGKTNGAAVNFTSVVSAIPVGLSYSFNWGLVLDLRYNIGLTNVNEPIEVTLDQAATTESFAVKNQVFVLSAGWRF